MRIIIVGGGQMVYFLVKELIIQSHHVTVINVDELECRALLRHVKATIVLGDGSDPSVLEDAGARQADVLLALTKHDADNLVACQVAQRMFGVPRVIALVNDPDNETIFRQLGVTVAFSATRIIAELLEDQASFDEIVKVIPVADGKVDVTEVNIHRDSRAVQITLNDLPLPEKALIASIIRHGEIIIPGGTTTLQVDDRVLLVAQPEAQTEALSVLVGDRAPA